MNLDQRPMFSNFLHCFRPFHKVFSGRFETQVPGAQVSGIRCAGFRCAGSRCQVPGIRCAGSRCQFPGIRCAGFRCQVPGIRCTGFSQILKLQELILNNPLTNIYVENLQYPSLQVSIIGF